MSPVGYTRVISIGVHFDRRVPPPSYEPVHFTTERTLPFVELHVRHTGVGLESQIPPSMSDGRNVGSGDFLTRFFL
jgi:hypothetical protein